MALPNTNISVAMVKSELGAATNKVEELCVHPNINKWSKWKPVRYESINPITETQLQSTNFGLYPPDSNPNYANVVGEKWEYGRPRGGSEPYRLSDFINYYHQAPAIMSVPISVVINRVNQSDFQYTASINRGGSSSDFIGIDDFSGLSGDIGSMYFGVVVVKGGVTYLVTAEDNLSDSGNIIELSTSLPPFNTNGVGTFYNILSTVSVPNITVLTNVSPAPYFISVPIADNRSDETPFEVKSDIGINIVVTRVGDAINNLSLASNYVPARASLWESGKQYYEGDRVWTTINGTIYVAREDHISGAVFSDDLFSGKWRISPANQYLPTGGNIYMQLNLTNVTETVQSFQVYNLNLRTNTTFFGSQYTAPATTYDNTTLNPITNSVTLQPSESKLVIVGVNNFFNRNNGVISTAPVGTEITAQLDLLTGVTVIGGIEINVISQ